MLWGEIAGFCNLWMAECKPDRNVNIWILSSISKTRSTKRGKAWGCLVNYRKGGQAFLNLVTLVPVSWETPELKYYVGFQAEARMMDRS